MPWAPSNTARHTLYLRRSRSAGALEGSEPQRAGSCRSGRPGGSPDTASPRDDPALGASPAVFRPIPRARVRPSPRLLRSRPLPRPHLCPSPPRPPCDAALWFKRDFGSSEGGEPTARTTRGTLRTARCPAGVSRAPLGRDEPRDQISTAAGEQETVRIWVAPSRRAGPRPHVAVPEEGGEVRLGPARSQRCGRRQRKSAGESYLSDGQKERETEFSGQGDIFFRGRLQLWELAAENSVTEKSTSCLGAAEGAQ